ncbi:MAG: alpha/beta hydrolase [Desulfocapsa sp.]|nr:alpha/beta hydrolase [Desulfocapsa sp.]
MSNFFVYCSSARKISTFLILLLFGAVILLPLPACSKIGHSIKKPAEEKSLGECVVLLHGMARSYHSMDDMQERLLAEGYHTVNQGYPSTREGIETIAEEYFPAALNHCRQFSPTAIHFVTHSLGGIVVRKGIKENKPEKLGRVVMLSSPNRGSAAVDFLRNWKIYQWLNGPAGQQLSTAPDSVPNQLGPVDYPVGIITGDRYAFFDGWLSRILPGKDDGKVSVERAKLEGMSDFLVVHESHPFIMDSVYVQDETVHFLKNGTFKHQKDPLPPVSGADWFSIQSK